jgi:hypothetical protein
MGVEDAVYVGVGWVATCMLDPPLGFCFSYSVEEISETRRTGVESEVTLPWLRFLKSHKSPIATATVLSGTKTGVGNPS